MGILWSFYGESIEPDEPIDRTHDEKAVYDAILKSHEKRSWVDIE